MTDAIPHKQGQGLPASGKGRGLTARGHVQSLSHSHLVTLDKPLSDLQVRESGVQTALPGFRCLAFFVRERRAGARERSPVCWRGCKSCFVSQGSSRKPGDPADVWDAGQGLRMTHPFLEEKQVSAEAQSRTGRKWEEDGDPSGHHCEDPYWAVQRLWTWPQARGWGWKAVNKGRVRNNKAGESENQEDLERLWYWFFFFFSHQEFKKSGTPLKLNADFVHSHLWVHFPSSHFPDSQWESGKSESHQGGTLSKEPLSQTVSSKGQMFVKCDWQLSWGPGRQNDASSQDQPWGCPALSCKAPWQ